MDTQDDRPQQQTRRGIARPPRAAPRRVAAPDTPGDGDAERDVTIAAAMMDEAGTTPPDAVDAAVDAAVERVINGASVDAPHNVPPQNISEDDDASPPAQRRLAARARPANGSRAAAARPRPEQQGNGQAAMRQRMENNNRGERPQRPRAAARVEDPDRRALSMEGLPAELALVEIPQLEALKHDQATELVEILGLPPASVLRREDMVHRAIQALGERGGVINASGILEITGEGYGFIRHSNLRHNVNDVYVAQSQIRRYGLRTGDWVTGQVRSPKSGEKYYGLLRVETVTGQDPEVSRRRPVFDHLTALFPDTLYDLETGQKATAARLLNLIAPIGLGQRALIVSPPKAGKTILLHQIADALSTRYPQTHIMAALIGERPEEVTDWQRTVKGAEVMASTFDEPVEEHTRVAEIVLARAKRLVEAGQDVVILLDSITRLARAYNIAAPSSGRTLSGGMDPVALYPPKHFFGAARNTEEAGTLTIIATCLVDTGSRLDDVIYEEFKGTGNMEVHLDRRLAERRVYPAIDVLKSGTRRDERLYDAQTYRGIVTLRRMLAMLSNSNLDSSDATERILDRVSKTKTNADFIATLSREI